MRKEKLILTEMPCALDPNFTVTPDNWAISLVQKNTGNYLTKQHANLILQSSLFGQINVMRLHINGSGGRRLNCINTINALVGTNVYLHVQIIDNLEKGVPIIDSESLENAVKAILGIPADKRHGSKLKEDFCQRTWQIKKEAALALVHDVTQQELICHNDKPTFSILGYESIFNSARAKISGFLNKTVQLPSRFLELAKEEPDIARLLAIVGGICCLSYIGNQMIKTSPVPVTQPTFTFTGGKFEIKTAVVTPRSDIIIITPVIGILSGYYTLAKQIRGPFDTALGHSCYTWAREMLMKHGDEDIKTDPCFKYQHFDMVVAVTSRHLLLDNKPANPSQAQRI